MRLNATAVIRGNPLSPERSRIGMRGNGVSGMVSGIVVQQSHNQMGQMATRA